MHITVISILNSTQNLTTPPPNTRRRYLQARSLTTTKTTTKTPPPPPPPPQPSPPAQSHLPTPPQKMTPTPPPQQLPPIATWHCPSHHRNPITRNPDTDTQPLTRLRCTTCHHPTILGCASAITPLPNARQDIIFHGRGTHDGFHSAAQRLDYAMDMSMLERRMVVVGYFCRCCGRTWRVEARASWVRGAGVLGVVGRGAWCRCGVRLWREGKYAVFEVVDRVGVGEAVEMGEVRRGEWYDG